MGRKVGMNWVTGFVDWWVCLSCLTRSVLQAALREEDVRKRDRDKQTERQTQKAKRLMNRQIYTGRWADGAHTYTCTFTHRHNHSCTHMCKHADMCSCTHMLTYTHMHAHTSTRMERNKMVLEIVQYEHFLC